MLNFVQKLQKKPEHTRRIIVVLTASILTSLIAIGWILTLDSRLSLAEEERTRSTVSPFSIITDEFSALYKSAVGQFERF